MPRGILPNSLGSFSTSTGEQLMPFNTSIEPMESDYRQKDLSDVDVMVSLIDRLRAKLKRKPSGYVQDQLAKAQAELRRRIASQSDGEGLSHDARTSTRSRIA